MNKIVNSDSTEGLPVYPNKSNPSNTEAIGGVFETREVVFCRRCNLEFAGLGGGGERCEGHGI